MSITRQWRSLLKLLIPLMKCESGDIEGGKQPYIWVCPDNCLLSPHLLISPPSLPLPPFFPPSLPLPSSYSTKSHCRMSGPFTFFKKCHIYIIFWSFCPLQHLNFRKHPILHVYPRILRTRQLSLIHMDVIIFVSASPLLWKSNSRVWETVYESLTYYCKTVIPSY